MTARTCADCAAPIGRRGKTSRCPPCAHARRFPDAVSARGRTCIDCSGPISRCSKERCAACSLIAFNSDPAIAARRLTAVRAHFAQPEVKAKVSARMRKLLANMSDEERERRREHGRDQHRRVLARPEVKARISSPEVRKRAGETRSATVLAWCPPGLRDKYRDLKKRGRSAPEARQIILDLIGGGSEPEPYAQQKAQLAWCPPQYRDEYRRLAKTCRAGPARRMIEELIAKEGALVPTAAAATPPAPAPRRPRTFEEQLAAVRAGARLITVHPMGSAAPARTLGGVATGLL